MLQQKSSHFEQTTQDAPNYMVKPLKTRGELVHVQFHLQGCSMLTCAIQASKPSKWSQVQSYVGTRFAQLVHPPNLASNADGGFMDMARISDFVWTWNIAIAMTYLQWKLTAWFDQVELLAFGIPFWFLEQPLLLPAWPVSIEVRTWDATPPVLGVVDVESRSEEILIHGPISTGLKFVVWARWRIKQWFDAGTIRTAKVW